MNKMWKRFWTLDRHNAEGFTLVELIVVIAILAILAGVAIPVYSGYIKKANEAADKQLLDAINTAFASACLQNGYSQYDVARAAIRVDADGKIDTTPVSRSAATATFFVDVVYKSGVTGNVAKLNEAFTNFYAGNENTAFKGIKSRSLMLNAATGMFVDPLNIENMTISYGDGFVQVSGAAINAMLNSTYYGEGMTSEKLLNQVDSVTTIAGGIGAVANVANTEAFADATLASLGVDTTGMTADQKAAKLEEKATAMALANLKYDQITASNQAAVAAEVKRLQNNALVLYTAQSTSSMDAADAKNLLNGVNSSMIKDAMDGELTEEDKAKGMNQAALAYGMYYAYINSSECEDSSLKKDDILAAEVISALDSNQDFKDYMASEQGTKDMEAYLQALGVISNGAQDPNATEKLLNEGFASQDLIGILEGAMGK